MDDQNWDDYLRQTEGTTVGDNARRWQKQATPPTDNFTVTGHSRGGDSGASRERKPMSDQGAAAWLGFFYGCAAAALLYIFADISIGWAGFFGVWAVVTIGLWIFPRLLKPVAAVFFVPLLIYGLFELVRAIL